MEYDGNETKVSPNFLKVIQLYIKGLVKERGAFLSTRKIYTFYDKNYLSAEPLYFDCGDSKLKKQRLKNFTYLQLLKELNSKQDYETFVNEYHNEMKNNLLIISGRRLHHLRDTLAKILNLKMAPQDKIVDCVLVSFVKEQGLTYMIADFIITEGV